MEYLAISIYMLHKRTHAFSSLLSLYDFCWDCYSNDRNCWDYVVSLNKFIDNYAVFQAKLSMIFFESLNIYICNASPPIRSSNIFKGFGARDLYAGLACCQHRRIFENNSFTCNDSIGQRPVLRYSRQLGPQPRIIEQ